jgi:hypothetical protein
MWMGVELVTVISNPYGNNIGKLRGLEKEFERRCPTFRRFESPCLRRIVYQHETESMIDQMVAERRHGKEIEAYMWRREREAPINDLGITPEEKYSLELRSYKWREESWEEGLLVELETRFRLSLDFFPCLAYVNFLDKVCLTDSNFRERHLAVSREVCSVLGQQEFLIVFDSAKPSSRVTSDFRDFEFQKQWLLENVGPPKPNLESMEIDIDEHTYELEGYYWERLDS